MWASVLSVHINILEETFAKLFALALQVPWGLWEKTTVKGVVFGVVAAQKAFENYLEQHFSTPGTCTADGN